jgi:hypothetical protein
MIVTTTCNEMTLWRLLKVRRSSVDINALKMLALGLGLGSA